MFLFLPKYEKLVQMKEDKVEVPKTPATPAAMVSQDPKIPMTPPPSPETPKRAPKEPELREVIPRAQALFSPPIIQTKEKGMFLITSSMLKIGFHQML